MVFIFYGTIFRTIGPHAALLLGWVIKRHYITVLKLKNVKNLGDILIMVFCFSHVRSFKNIKFQS